MQLTVSPPELDIRGNLDIRCFDQSIASHILDEVVLLSKLCEIGEEFDTSCDLVYLWVIDNKIVGVAAFKLYQFKEGRIVPRFEHIFGVEKVQKTMRGVKFLLSVMSDIKTKGYDAVWCYIKPEKNYMKILANKFGFKLYASDEAGEFYIKQL